MRPPRGWKWKSLRLTTSSSDLYSGSLSTEYSRMARPFMIACLRAIESLLSHLLFWRGVHHLHAERAIESFCTLK